MAKLPVMKVDNARIIHRNFEGRGGKFNREGDRSFSLVLDSEEQAQLLAEAGWTVKVKPSKDPDGEPLCFLKVKVSFREPGNPKNPVCYLRTNGRMRELDEESIGILDGISIESVDLDINPSPYDVNGKKGIAAYLAAICVTQNVDRFRERYASEFEDEEE